MLPILHWLRVRVPEDLENRIRAPDIRLVTGFDTILETPRMVFQALENIPTPSQRFQRTPSQLLHKVYSFQELFYGFGIAGKFPTALQDFY